MVSTISEVLESRRLPRAERANRELAKAAGPMPAAIDSVPRKLGPFGALRRTLPIYLVSGALFGLADTAIDGRPVTIARVAWVGGLWAVLDDAVGHGPRPVPGAFPPRRRNVAPADRYGDRCRAR